MPRNTKNWRNKAGEKRFSVVYRRSSHDRRTYNMNQYIPHFLEIFYATHGRPDEETLKRVHIDREGRYSYEPSMRYLAFRRLLRMKMTKKFTNEGVSQGVLF